MATNKDAASGTPPPGEGSCSSSLGYCSSSALQTADATAAHTLPGFLPWEDDLDMVSKYLDRKEELEESHRQYMQENPGLRAVLADFLQAVLIQKPDNVYQFAKEFFSPFSPAVPPKPSFPSHLADS